MILSVAFSSGVRRDCELAGENRESPNPPPNLRIPESLNPLNRKTCGCSYMENPDLPIDNAHEPGSSGLDTVVL